MQNSGLRTLAAVAPPQVCWGEMYHQGLTQCRGATQKATPRHAHAHCAMALNPPPCCSPAVQLPAAALRVPCACAPPPPAAPSLQQPSSPAANTSKEGNLAAGGGLAVQCRRAFSLPGTASLLLLYAIPVHASWKWLPGAAAGRAGGSSAQHEHGAVRTLPNLTREPPCAPTRVAPSSAAFSSHRIVLSRLIG